MKITETTRQTVLGALKQKKMSQAAFAKEMGFGRAWATKFLKGGKDGLKRIEPETLHKMEDLLGIALESYTTKHVSVPSFAFEVADVMDSRPDLAKIIAAVMELQEPAVVHSVPHFTNKELIKFGAEATRIVSEWDQGGDPHYNKIGLELLVLVREIIEDQKN